MAGLKSLSAICGTSGQPTAVSVLDLETSERHTLSGMTATAVAWMPDGHGLLIAAPAPDGVNHWIWRLPMEGGLPEPVLKGAVHWDAPSASPDGAGGASPWSCPVAQPILTLCN